MRQRDSKIDRAIGGLETMEKGGVRYIDLCQLSGWVAASFTSLFALYDMSLL